MQVNGGPFPHLPTSTSCPPQTLCHSSAFVSRHYSILQTLKWLEREEELAATMQKGFGLVPAIPNLPYSRKYWQSLNLAVWPQTKRKKILAEFKFVLCIVLHHHKHCTRIYQGVLLSSHLRYLNDVVSTRNITGSVLVSLRCPLPVYQLLF